LLWIYKAVYFGKKLGPRNIYLKQHPRIYLPISKIRVKPLPCPEDHAVVCDPYGQIVSSYQPQRLSPSMTDKSDGYLGENTTWK